MQRNSPFGVVVSNIKRVAAGPCTALSVKMAGIIHNAALFSKHTIQGLRVAGVRDTPLTGF